MKNQKQKSSPSPKPSPNPTPRPKSGLSVEQQLEAIRQSAKAADLSTSTQQNQFDWIALLVSTVAGLVKFPFDKNVTQLPVWCEQLKTSAGPVQTPERQLELIRQCAEISPGNMTNQIGGAAMLMMATQRALKLPNDQHMRELVTWTEGVVKTLPQ